MKISEDVLAIVRKNPNDYSFELKRKVNVLRMKHNAQRRRSEKGHAMNTGFNLVSRLEVKEAMVKLGRPRESVRTNNQNNRRY